MDQRQDKKSTVPSFTSIFLIVLQSTFAFVMALIGALALPPNLRILGFVSIAVGLCVTFVVSLGIFGYLRYREPANQGILNALDLYIPPLAGKARELRLAQLGRQLETLESDTKAITAACVMGAIYACIIVKVASVAFHFDSTDTMIIIIILIFTLFFVGMGYNECKCTQVAKEYEALAGKRWKSPAGPPSVEWLYYGGG